MVAPIGWGETFAHAHGKQTHWNQPLLPFCKLHRHLRRFFTRTSYSCCLCVWPTTWAWGANHSHRGGCEYRNAGYEWQLGLAGYSCGEASRQSGKTGSGDTLTEKEDPPRVKAVGETAGRLDMSKGSCTQERRLKREEQLTPCMVSQPLGVNEKTININISGHTSGGLQAIGRVNGHNLSFLVDTGAAVTLIQKDVWDEVSAGSTVKLEPWNKRQLVSVDGNPLHWSQTSQHGHHSRWHQVLIRDCVGESTSY